MKKHKSNFRANKQFNKVMQKNNFRANKQFDKVTQKKALKITDSTLAQANKHPILSYPWST